MSKIKGLKSLGGANVIVTPNKNTTPNGSQKWKDTMKEFMQDTMPYLKQYYQRNNSKSGFAADKNVL